MSEEDQVLKFLERFETKFDSKVDKLDSRLDNVEKTQVKQEANLGEHMRRTSLAEENMVLIRKDIKPLQKHVAYFEGALKLLGGVATLILVVEGAIQIYRFFRP